MIVFGIDAGIASVGWAVIDDGVTPVRLAAGVRAFDPPEVPKTRMPTNSARRQARGQRRVIRRRRQRMNQIRELLLRHGLVKAAGRDALRLAIDPWRARGEGLERLLNRDELAAVLGHIARHRGFKSNSKKDHGSNEVDETSKMLKAIAATEERLGRWRTVGEAFVKDPLFDGRKRNRGGSFDRSVLRADLAAEIKAIFAAQARFGSTTATQELLEAFAEIAFMQRPLQDSEALLGHCPFEPNEKRTAKHCYSFELFRLLSRLNAIRLNTPQGPVALSPGQVSAIAAEFGKSKGISYAAVRRLLDFSDATRFPDVDRADESKRDIVARSGSAAEGTYTLRQALAEGAWRGLLATPGKLDRIAEILTFRDAPESIRQGLEEASIEPEVIAPLMDGVASGRFARFSGAAHISAKAARAILPGLFNGLVYSEACAEAGYDHAAQTDVQLEDIRNPTVRRAIGEIVKQVRVMASQFGRPDYIHLEMARDVGKSAEERDEITRGIEKRNKEKDKARERLESLLERRATGEELLRFELWEEQNGRCLYTDQAISPLQLAASDASVQVDHILPWSRFGDDSFFNKTLCLADANQRKRGRTPYEWFRDDMTPQAWAAFQARVESSKAMKGRKKRGYYLRQNAAEVEEAFRSRNLNDTRYALRLAANLLEKQFGVPGERRILARPGALTSKLRRTWGLESLKKDKEGNRLEDDRNHAVDASVVAAISESLLQHLTLLAQKAERQGLKRDFAEQVPEPFENFREAVKAARDGVFVSRSERRRARGQAHDATVRQVRERDGETVVYARRAVSGLSENMLDEIKDVERNGALRAVLSEWIKAGKPKDRLPVWPMLSASAQADFDAAVAEHYPQEWAAGGEAVGLERREARRLLRRRFEVEHPDAARSAQASDEGVEIRSVLVRVKDKPALHIRGGTAARGEMVRVDVFREIDQRGRSKFHLVPIYVHQIFDKHRYSVPPSLAVVAYRDESEWPNVGKFTFIFSIYSNSLLEATYRNGEVIKGYFRGLNRSTGAISLAAPDSSMDIKSGIGVKTLLNFRKLTVSRLGAVSEVPGEVRTWRGKACT